MCCAPNDSYTRQTDTFEWKYSVGTTGDDAAVGRPPEVVLPVPVAVLEHEREPTEVALREDRLEPREPLERATEDPVDERELRVERTGDRLDDERRVRRRRDHPRRRTEVEAQRQLGFLRGREHRVPVAVGVVQRREPLTVRVLGERDRPPRPWPRCAAAPAPRAAGPSTATGPWRRADPAPIPPIRRSGSRCTPGCTRRRARDPRAG